QEILLVRAFVRRAVRIGDENLLLFLPVKGDIPDLFFAVYFSYILSPDIREIPCLFEDRHDRQVFILFSMPLLQIPGMALRSKDHNALSCFQELSDLFFVCLCLCQKERNLAASFDLFACLCMSDRDAPVLFKAREEDCSSLFCPALRQLS